MAGWNAKGREAQDFMDAGRGLKPQKPKGKSDYFIFDEKKIWSFEK